MHANRATTQSAAAVLLLLIAAGCSDQLPPGPGDPVAPRQDATDRSGNAQRPIDDELAGIAAKAPGFGGMFFDEDGVLNVYLADPAQEAAARTAVAEAFGPRRPVPAVRVLKGEYDFRELAGWHALLPEVLALSGVVLTDIDEAHNRLRVGISDAGARDRVLGALDRLRIPRDAVLVEEADPIYQVLTLRDVVRPTYGGVQINFPGFLCTLGFNADGLNPSDHSWTGVRYFVTNSHCTSVQGGVESTQYWQPLNGATTHIGTEITDPVYFSGAPCPAGRVCRYSDASMAQYTSPSLASLGKISRTTSRGTTLGSITFATPDNFDIFNVWGYSGFSAPFVGQFLDKVGRTTGWTGGQMTASCVNVNVSGTNITQLCQNFVSAGVGGGDSGSPVFDSNAWAGQSVAVNLYGILWGGNTAGTLFVFSPMPSVISELGPALFAWCYC